MKQFVLYGWAVFLLVAAAGMLIPGLIGVIEGYWAGLTLEECYALIAGGFVALVVLFLTYPRMWRWVYGDPRKHW